MRRAVWRLVRRVFKNAPALVETCPACFTVYEFGDTHCPHCKGAPNMRWHNRYLIDNRRFSMGFDLTDWALPLKIGIAPANLHVEILCFDFDLYWGLEW